MLLIIVLGLGFHITLNIFSLFFYDMVCYFHFSKWPFTAKISI